MANVLVLFGGVGEEHAVSCLSAGEVLSHGAPKGDVFLPLGITKEGKWFFFRDPSPTAVAKGDFSGGVPARLVREGTFAGIVTEEAGIPVDLVLPVLHGDFGEDGRMQGFLDILKIPYVGSGVAAGAAAADKEVAKLYAQHLGIPTLPWITFNGASADDALAALHGAFGNDLPPLFIKPASLGSSVGAYRAPDETAFRLRYPLAAKYGKVLVEPDAFPVREIECGWFSDGDVTLVAGPGQITSHAAFYDYTEKYTTLTAKIETKTDLSGAQLHTVRDATERLARALGVRDLCRVDFFLSSSGEILFNEINTFPGLTAASLYPRLVAAAGIPYAEMIARLVRRGIARGV